VKQKVEELWTIGHSTRSIEEFISLLKLHQIETLVDVRQFPGSRRLPHFNHENLEKILPGQGIDYVHLVELGGRRKVQKDSPNDNWRHPAFRGYADYMMTEAFALGIEKLLQIAQEKRTAIMCSEVLWWRCHRAMISDFLKVHGVLVHHILSATKIEDHPFTSAARIVDGKLSYSAAESPMEFKFD
jgi:uncharacterized protein (DUF488 family)